MSGEGKLYDEATEVSAKDGEVILDGPDGVDVKLTPEAAEQTSDNLLEGAAKAAGQRKLRGQAHQPK
jgi:osmotically-inducible protein OsmY